VKINQQIDD